MMSSYEHFPLNKIRKQLVNLLASSSSTKKTQQQEREEEEEEPYYVLLTTGAMNPISKGHATNLTSSANILSKKYGKKVIGAFLSPSSDCYLAGKFFRVAKGEDFFFCDSVRYRACQLALQNDPFIEVGGYEVDMTLKEKRWPDFPEVCTKLQQHLQQTLAQEFKGCKFEVLYLCGSDHALKCGIDGGVHTGSQGKKAGFENGICKVVATCRAGDEGKMRKTESLEKDHFLALPPLEGDLADVSSTKIRKSLIALSSNNNNNNNKKQEEEARMFLQHAVEPAALEYIFEEFKKL